MPRRRKSNRTPILQEPMEITLTQAERNIKSGSNNNNTLHTKIANISHKKSNGANNWTAFKESVPKETLINKNQNSEKSLCQQLNTVKLISKENNHFRKKSSVPSKTYTILSRPQKPVDDLKGVEEKLVVNMNKQLTRSQSPAFSKVLTKQIAMDCEMVGVEIGVNNNMLARISLVNSLGDCIYDKFVKPTEPVLDYRTHVSGVRPANLENAEDFKIVQKEVADIIKGRVLVGHGLKHDLKVLFLSHPRHEIRDTSQFKKFKQGRTPSLKTLVMKYLGVTIQEGEHSSVQDALGAMQLYRMFKKEWEASIKKSNYIKKKKAETSHTQETLEA